MKKIEITEEEMTKTLKESAIKVATELTKDANDVRTVFMVSVITSLVVTDAVSNLFEKEADA